MLDVLADREMILIYQEMFIDLPRKFSCKIFGTILLEEGPQ